MPSDKFPKAIEKPGIEKAQTQITIRTRQEDATPKKAALINQEIAYIEENDEVFGAEHEYSKKLQAIAEKLRDPKSKEKIECKVINAKDVNALACGNTVYLYAGMLAFCETEAELAYILAHEITHIESGDTWTEESSLSQARAGEYYADSVMHKLNDVGYNPVAIENILRKLPKYGEVDHVHGSSADRQAAVRMQLKLRDHAATTTKDDIPSSFVKDKEKIKKQSKVGITERFMTLARNRSLYKIKVEELDKISLVTHFKFLEKLYEEISKSYMWPSPYDNPIERWQHKRDLTKKMKQMNVFMEYIGQRISKDLEGKESKDITAALFLDFAKIDLTDVAKMKKDLGYKKVRFNFPEGFWKDLIEYAEKPEKFVSLLENSSKISQDIGNLKIATRKEPRDLAIGNTPESLAILVSGINFDARISGFPQETALQSIRLNLDQRSSKDQKFWGNLVMACVAESCQDLKEEFEDFFKQFETEEENPKFDYQDPDQFKERYKHIYFSAKRLLSAMGITTTTSELSDFMRQNIGLFYSEQQDILKNAQAEIAHVELEAKPIIQDIKIAITERNVEELEKAFGKIDKSEIAAFFNQFAAKDLWKTREDYKFFIDFVYTYLQNKFQITQEHKEELLYKLASDRKFNLGQTRREIWKKVKEKGIDQTLEELHLSGDLFKPLLSIYVFEMMSAQGDIDCERIIDKKNIDSLSYFSKLILVKKFLSPEYKITLNSKSLSLLIESLDKDLQNKDLVYHARVIASFATLGIFQQSYDRTKTYDLLLTLRGNFFKRLEQSSNSENLDRANIGAILYSLGNLFGKGQERELSQVKSKLRLDLLKLLNFDEALEKIKAWKAEGTLHYTHVDYVQENLMRNTDSKHKLESLMRDYVKEAKAEHSEFGSALVLLDKTFEDAIDRPYPWGMSANKILDAMLNSKYDDSLLRQIMVTFWTEKIGVRYFHDDSLDTIEGARRHLERTQTFDDYMDAFYEEISENDIEAILAKLLISPRGVLRYGQGIKVILKALEKEIGAEDPEFKKLILLVAQCGMRSVDPVRIFKPIADILRHRVLRRPEEKSSNNLAQKRLLDLEKSSATDIITLQALENLKKKQRIKNLMIAQEAVSRERLVPNEPVAQNVEKSSQESIREKIVENSGIFKKDEKESVTDPMDYVLALAQNMGAVGVRFLQILGQYIEIPPNYQSRFAGVFDAQRGQIKWTAIDTIEREVKSGPKQFQEFWSGVTDISETIGGGSLMTVYKVKAGEKDYVVKVLNPNAQEFIRQNISDIEKILKDKKGKLGKKFPLTQSLVHDLSSWLNQDISSRHKRQETDEFALAAEERESKMHLPGSIYTGTQYVMIEEYVPGKNLNELKTSDPARYKDLIKIMVEDYRGQMKHFYADGKTRIHTDPHVGNIRLGDDGSLYWLDRGYYIECTREEMNVLSPILSGEVNLSGARKFLDLLLSDEANKDKSKTKMVARSVAGLSRLLRGKGDLSQRVNIFFKEVGIEIPVRYSLLFKNEAVIDNLLK